MVYNLNTTNLAQVDGGYLIKQGDVASTFGFVLLDEDYRAVPSLEGEAAVISLTMGKYQWKKKVAVTNSSVNFNLDAILPIGKYRLEISAGGYIFPSDKETHIKIVASEVGADNKVMMQLINTKIDNATLTQAIEQAKTAVKAEILGDGVPENLDTLKEIATMISGMSGDTEAAVVKKLADLGRRIDEFANVDLVATYNAAKA